MEAQPTPAPQRTIASYTSYGDAERSVDYLSDRGFEVHRVTIVGRDLEFLEQVTGRQTAATAALRGAVSGALIGALIGWLFGVFDWIDPLIAGLLVALYGLVFGAIVGALIGWLLGLFSLIEPLISAVLLALWGVLIGGVLGALIGLIGHALTRGRRDFSSVSSVQADRYDIVASPTVAEDAERELAEIIRSAPELQRTT